MQILKLSCIAFAFGLILSCAYTSNIVKLHDDTVPKDKIAVINCPFTLIIDSIVFHDAPPLFSSTPLQGAGQPLIFLNPTPPNPWGPCKARYIGYNNYNSNYIQISNIVDPMLGIVIDKVDGKSLEKPTRNGSIIELVEGVHTFAIRGFNDQKQIPSEADATLEVTLQGGETYSAFYRVKHCESFNERTYTGYLFYGCRPAIEQGDFFRLNFK